MTKSGKMFFDYVMGFFCVFFDNENCERGNVICKNRFSYTATSEEIRGSLQDLLFFQSWVEPLTCSGHFYLNRPVDLQEERQTPPSSNYVCLQDCVCCILWSVVVDLINYQNTDLLACLWIDLYTVISIQKGKGLREPSWKVVYSETLVTNHGYYLSLIHISEPTRP